MAGNRPESPTHYRQPHQNHSQRHEFGLAHPNTISIWDNLSIRYLAKGTENALLSASIVGLQDQRRIPWQARKLFTLSG
jgi:hypothetical protein